MKPERLDHVALWVSDREAVTRRVMTFFPGVDVLEQTGEFTLLGADPELGKLTLFEAPGPREESQLMHVAFRTPHAEDAEDIQIGEALHLLRIGNADASAPDLDHLALRVPDPETSALRWTELGFEGIDPRIEFSVRLKLGETCLELHPGTPLPTDRPLLNHVGVRVESIDPYLEGSVDIELEILETMDAPGSRSVFVQAPDDVRLELIELKPSFTEARQRTVSSRPA